MHLVIFGTTISSAAGNEHANLWRALLRALAKRGHTVTFYERDVPYYASARDGWRPPEGVSLLLYAALDAIRDYARRDADDADVAMFTSSSADGAAAAQLILDSRAALKVFYDLDTAATIESVRGGGQLPYLPAEGFGGFDLVLSLTGGKALDELRPLLNGRVVAPLYGSADPDAHVPVAPVEGFCGVLSYLGAYAADRQRALEELFIEPARRLPRARLQLAGAQYPENICWPQNIVLTPHLDPRSYPAFFCSSRATLHITAAAMARFGGCPTQTLFEAAARGVPILSDGWEGLEMFFAPGREILRVDSADDVIAALSLTDVELHRMAEAARENVLARHTAERRVEELEALCQRVAGRTQPCAAAF